MKFFIASFITIVQVTAYQPVPEQCDNTPHEMASGYHVMPGCLAVSRDLHEKWGGPLKFGDTVYVEELGYYLVCDLMNKRHKNRVDILVFSTKEESEIWKKFKNKKVKLWKMLL